MMERTPRASVVMCLLSSSLLIMGKAESPCASFIVLNVTTVGHNTVSLKAKVQNLCPTTSLSLLIAKVPKPDISPKPLTICQILVMEDGGCRPTPSNCSCDQYGDFIITRKLNNDAEFWTLFGELKNGETFSLIQEVWVNHLVTTIKPATSSIATSAITAAASTAEFEPVSYPPDEGGEEGKRPESGKDDPRPQTSSTEDKGNWTIPGMDTTSSSPNGNLINSDSKEFGFILLGSIGGGIFLIVIFICILCGVLSKIKNNERPGNVPDNYEHPNSHHYDRFMPQLQPSALQALNANINRESVLDLHYTINDDDLELNVLPPPPESL